MSTLTGWRTAARYVGDTLSPMRLRTMVKRGTLRAVKNNDGVYEFDTRDLDVLRATLAPASTACGDTMTSQPVVACAAITSAPALAATVNGGSAPQLPAVTAGWMLAATSTPSRDENDDDDADADQVSHEPPFWASSSPFPEGTPVIDPLTMVVTYVSSTPTSHAPGTTGAVIAQLQQQLVDTQTQLVATHAAWRHQRVATVAAEIAIEALMSGTQPQVAMVARDASHAAAAALTDDELRREDGYAVAIARGAGMAAAQQAGAALAHAWQAQQVPWPSPPPRDPQDELSRARARRRSRSPRW